MKKKAIVIAWVVTENQLVPGQKAWRHDLGERPSCHEVLAAKACMWRNEGTAEDIELAKAYAAGPGQQSVTGAVKCQIFVYPTTEKNPLGRAQKEVLK